jgi:AraC family transcriptional activator of mtrCDE
LHRRSHSFTPPWGIEVPAYENVARFHFAHRGDCQVRVIATGETLTLAQGDLVLIPHRTPHCLFSGHSPDDVILPLDEVLEKSGYKGEGVLVYGGEDDNRETQLICGHMSFGKDASHLIFDQLPPFIHIPNYGEVSGKWMEATLRVVGEEAGRGQFGGDLITLKMSEVIFAQAIRTFIYDQGKERVGLAGFTDPNLSRALNAFHRQPAEVWSVEDLAKEAGLSRTSFAQKFSQKMGLTPMQYLTSWRMQIARQGLTEQRMSVSDVAAVAGYASESAFTRVFKKGSRHDPGKLPDGG